MRFHPPTPPSLGHMPSSNSQGGCSNSMVFWQGMPPTQSTHGLTFMAARCSQAPTSRSAQGLWCHEECSHSHWREVWTWLSVALCPLCLNNRPDRCSFRRATVVSGHHLRWSHHAWSLTPTHLLFTAVTWSLPHITLSTPYPQDSLHPLALLGTKVVGIPYCQEPEEAVLVGQPALPLGVLEPWVRGARWAQWRWGRGKTVPTALQAQVRDQMPQPSFCGDRGTCQACRNISQGTTLIWASSGQPRMPPPWQRGCCCQ